MVIEDPVGMPQTSFPRLCLAHLSPPARPGPDFTLQDEEPLFQLIQQRDTAVVT